MKIRKDNMPNVMLGKDPNERFQSEFGVEQMLLQIQITLKDEGEKGLEQIGLDKWRTRVSQFEFVKNGKRRAACFKFFCAV